MSRNLYSKTEGMLYNHYKRKKRISSLRSRLIRIENRIDSLRRDIKECNLDLGETMKAIDYSRDASGSNSISSNIERELELAVDRVLKEIENSIREKYKTISKINHLQKDVDNIEVLLEELQEEELQLIELKYGENKNYREMENILPMTRSTIQRKKDEIIKDMIDKIK